MRENHRFSSFLLALLTSFEKNDLITIPADIPWGFSILSVRLDLKTYVCYNCYTSMLS